MAIRTIIQQWSLKHSLNKTNSSSPLLTFQKARKEPSFRRFAPPNKAGQEYSLPGVAVRVPVLVPVPVPAVDVEKGIKVTNLPVSGLLQIVIVVWKTLSISYVIFY